MEVSSSRRMVPNPEVSARPSREIRILWRGTKETLEDNVHEEYVASRGKLFNPAVPLNSDLIRKVLETRLADIDKSISSSNLKGATDRDGFPLGSLKELTIIAVKQLNGEINTKSVLKKQLDMITEEEDHLVRASARNHVSELPQIDKRNGNIIITSFNNETRQTASNEARKMVEQFTAGKDRLQNYMSGLN